MTLKGFGVGEVDRVGLMGVLLGGEEMGSKGFGETTEFGLAGVEQTESEGFVRDGLDRGLGTKGDEDRVSGCGYECDLRGKNNIGKESRSVRDIERKKGEGKKKVVDQKRKKRCRKSRGGEQKKKMTCSENEKEEKKERMRKELTWYKTSNLALFLKVSKAVL